MRWEEQVEKALPWPSEEWLEPDRRNSLAVGSEQDRGKSDGSSQKKWETVLDPQKRNLWMKR